MIKYYLFKENQNTNSADKMTTDSLRVKQIVGRRWSVEISNQRITPLRCLFVEVNTIF